VFLAQSAYADLNKERTGMARAPNYNQERKERDRIKAAKKAEKLAAKSEKGRTKSAEESKPEAEK
jgi:hypothetical protein